MFTGEQFFEEPLGPKRPASPGLFIASDGHSPRQGSAQWATLPRPPHLAVGEQGSCRRALGVPRWMALSFYQQKRRLPSPDVRSLPLLQAQPCPVPSIRSSGECLTSGSASGSRPAVLGPGKCFQQRTLSKGRRGWVRADLSTQNSDVTPHSVPSVT